MINSNQIKQNCVVVGNKNEPFGAVDQMDGLETIKLKKDENGQIHFIPLSWVAKVDDKIHLSISAETAMKEWLTTPKPQVTNMEHKPSSYKSDYLLPDHATSFVSNSNELNTKMAKGEKLSTPGEARAKKKATKQPDANKKKNIKNEESKESTKKRIS